MKMLLSACSFLFLVVELSWSQTSNCTSAGDPLLLTNLLLNCSHIEAQKLSEVNPPIGDVKSYAGFFTVNETCNSNIFFWFIPALEDWKKAPLVIWLQGGPGSSSMYGLFEEIGPFTYVNNTLGRRKYSWNNLSNLLFIDQPVGSGYSYTNNVTECYPRNEIEVGRDLYQAVLQFYMLFPIFVKNNNSLFIAGESYAGHWIPALAHTIIENNANASLKINITALLISGAWIHPITQCVYSQLLYGLGFYDRAAQLIDLDFENEFRDDMETGNYSDAALVCGAQMGGIFQGLAGERINVYNYVNATDDGNYQDFVQRCDIREALHVGNSTFLTNNIQTDTGIQISLYEDLVTSVKPWVEELLGNRTVTIFLSGQLDLIAAYSLTEEVLRNLTWPGQNTYLNATRTKWCVDEVQAGFFKGNDTLYDILIRCAGHTLSKDQPEWMYQVIESILSGSPEQPFHRLQACNQTN